MKKLSDSIGQFATIPNSFILASVDLSTEAKWLFVVLRYHTNSKTGQAFPSYESIRELTGFHRKTIAKALKELEASGWLVKQRRYSASSLYTLQIPISSLSDTTEPSSSSISRTISRSTSVTTSSSHGVHTNQTEEETRSKEPEDISPPARVFHCWKETMGSPKARLDVKRRDLIKKRLADGYSVDDLCIAIRGCSESAFHMGKNDRSAKYNDITLICRDAKHVDQFIEVAQGENGNGFSLRGGMNSADVEAMLRG